MLNDILKGVESVRERVIGFRREMHRNPELSAEEVKTAALVAGVLDESGIELRRNVGGHGVVGLLRGGGDGPTIALRADMDALPISDAKGVGYASAVDGVMHACGHDVHTAVLMGTALVLAKLRAELNGNVKFIFQPSEERSATGALLMIEDGALKDPVPKAAVALHCFPEMEAGTVGHKHGVMTASSDRFTIVVKGKSGHASRPHQTVDAVLLGAIVINAIHHIVSRRTDPLHHAVISIGTIKGGYAPNVIADTVRMEGIVRTLDSGARKRVRSLIEETIKGVTHGMGGDYELEYHFGTASVVNDKKVDAFVAGCARDILGDRNVIEMDGPLMGAEDFSCFLEKVPGTLFRLGTGNRAKGITAHLHSADFDVDEEAIMVGVRLMSWVAARFLSADKGA
jgi:amidohydrolase